MSVRVDQRDVVERMEDVVRAADFEERTGVEVTRCVCGASLIVACDGVFVCEGCGVPRVGLIVPENSSPADLGGAAGRGGRCFAARWLLWSVRFVFRSVR